jgi:hypothetical protein
MYRRSASGAFSQVISLHEVIAMTLLGKAIAIVGLSAALAAPAARGGAESASAVRSVTLYVSAAFGTDGWSGRLAAPNSAATDGPLASLDGARRAVRAIDKNGLDKVTVLLRDGTSRVRLAELGGLPRLADFDGGGPAHAFRDGVYTDLSGA